MTNLGRISFAAAIGAAALFSAISAFPQGKRNLLAPEASAPAPRSGGGGGGGGGGRTVKIYVPKIERRTERIPITSFQVGTKEGAKVVLESPAVKGRKAYRQEKIADATGAAVFQAMPAGTYQVEASKDGFVTVRAKDVGIVAQTAQGISLFPTEITYKVKIKTDVTGGGDIRFAPAIYKGRNADGTINSEKLGPYCVAKIQEDGLAEISDLKKLYYDIDIQPDSLEFAKTFTGIDLTKSVDENDNPDSAILKTYNLSVEKNQSKETFSTTWIPSDWEMPSSWLLEDRRMRVKNVDGIAIPRDSRFRNYVNFEMVAFVKLRENGTVGFVFRYEDAKNYYLFQISGERGETPNNAVLYVVKDGKRQPLLPALTTGFAKTLASDDGFEVRVQSDDRGGFTAWVEDSNTGKTNALARFPDDYKTFTKGAVGIAGSPKSNFEIRSFQVCTPLCPK